MGRRATLSSAENQRIVNLYEFFEKEWTAKIFLVRQNKLNERVASGLEISVSSVKRARKSVLEQTPISQTRDRRKKYDSFTV